MLINNHRSLTASKGSEDHFASVASSNPTQRRSRSRDLLGMDSSSERGLQTTSSVHAEAGEDASSIRAINLYKY